MQNQFAKAGPSSAKAGGPDLERLVHEDLARDLEVELPKPALQCLRPRPWSKGRSGPIRSRRTLGREPGEVETDLIILLRRQRQIDYGKNTQAYAKYVEKVPEETRPSYFPRTPNK